MINRHRYLRIGLLLAAGLVSPALAQLLGDEPLIRSMIPDSPAIGRWVAIQGHFLCQPDCAQTVVTFTQGAVALQGSMIPGASRSTEIYVVVPGGLHLGKVDVTVQAFAGGRTSKPFSFQAKDKPAAPVPRVLCDIFLKCPVVAAAVGTSIGVANCCAVSVADRAIFSQGDVEIAAPPYAVGISNQIGVISFFQVPEGLRPGPTLVQWQVTVDGKNSDLSYGLPFDVVP
jgi:hypothetical protein